MYGMYFCLLFLYCNLLQITLVEGLLLPFLYIHTCVTFNKCIQTLKMYSNINYHSWLPRHALNSVFEGIGVTMPVLNTQLSKNSRTLIYNIIIRLLHGFKSICSCLNLPSEQQTETRN